MAKKEEIIKKSTGTVSTEDLDEDLDTEELVEEGDDDFSEEDDEKEESDVAEDI